MATKREVAKKIDLYSKDYKPKVGSNLWKRRNPGKEEPKHKGGPSIGYNYQHSDYKIEK